MAEDEVEVRVSSRRTRSMSAFREQGRIVVVVPAHLSQRQRTELVAPLVERFLAREARRGAPRGEHDLSARATALWDAYVAPHEHGRRPLIGVRWVSNQNRRWGSCTPETGEIRVSDRLLRAPAWVVDSVLLHEVTHLAEPGHTPRFHAIVSAYPDLERAEAFLAGMDFVERG